MTDEDAGCSEGRGLAESVNTQGEYALQALKRAMREHHGEKCSRRGTQHHRANRRGPTCLRVEHQDQSLLAHFEQCWGGTCMHESGWLDRLPQR
jgi:hypothetical protein